MTEMKKIVVEGFPVERLPEEVRRGIENGQKVKVTVEAQSDGTHQDRRSMRSFLGSAPGLYAGPQDAVEFIRSLREESDR